MLYAESRVSILEVSDAVRKATFLATDAILAGGVCQLGISYATDFFPGPTKAECAGM